MTATIQETEYNDNPLPPKIIEYCRQNSDNRVPPTSHKTLHLFSKESLQQRLLEIGLRIKTIDDKLNEIYDNEYVLICF